MLPVDMDYQKRMRMIYLVLAAPDGRHGAALIFSLSLSALLGTSALYHRVNWSEKHRMWFRRLDRTMIFVLIAGTYAPFGMLIFQGWLNEVVFWSLWGFVGLGFLLNVVWAGAPKWLRASLYVLVGWFGVPMLPMLFSKTGIWCAGLLLAGGIAYTVGAVFYALKKPNIVPQVFGYHELFHSFVLLGAVLHGVDIAVFVLPYAIE